MAFAPKNELQAAAGTRNCKRMAKTDLPQRNHQAIIMWYHCNSSREQKMPVAELCGDVLFNNMVLKILQF